MEKINMSRKEMEQIELFEKLKRGEILQKDVAIALNLTSRQIRNKQRLYEESGPQSLIHKNRGRESKKKWDPKEEALAISLLKSEWYDFGPTFAAEKLLEVHGIKVSEETMRKRMIQHEVWTAHRRKIKHRVRRMRKAAFGIMVQLDGSPHDWFEGRGEKCTLLVFIDDATSKIVWLEFAKSESLEGVMKASWNYFNMHGIPRSFYTDYGSVFSVNTNNPERDKITQFERAMKELDVAVIHARSPQAKGRVERSNKTHQDRLVKEMRLQNISTIEAANQFLQTHYMDKHNLKFAKEPADSTNVHRSIDGRNLNNILCVREERKLCNDFTIVHQKRIFQLDSQQKAVIKPKDEITVNIHLDRSIRLSIRSIDLEFKEVQTKPEKQLIEKETKVFKYRKPSENSRRSLSRFFTPKSVKKGVVIEAGHAGHGGGK